MCDPELKQKSAVITTNSKNYINDKQNIRRHGCATKAHLERMLISKAIKFFKKNDSKLIYIQHTKVEPQRTVHLFSEDAQFIEKNHGKMGFPSEEKFHMCLLDFAVNDVKSRNRLKLYIED